LLELKEKLPNIAPQSFISLKWSPLPPEKEDSLQFVKMVPAKVDTQDFMAAVGDLPNSAEIQSLQFIVNASGKSVRLPVQVLRYFTDIHQYMYLTEPIEVAKRWLVEELPHKDIVMSH
jgi:hypothetical protein